MCTGYQASFSFNLVDILQTQGDHIAKCIGACREKDAVMDASEESEEWWVQQVIANRGKSNYAKNCTPGCERNCRARAPKPPTLHTSGHLVRAGAQEQ